MSHLIAELLLLLSLQILGQVPPPEAAITFQIRNAGITVNGTLEGFESTVRFDPQHPEEAQIEASVAVSTIKTGIALRDKHLQKPDYFHAEQHPRISLRSQRIRATGPGRYEGTFLLRIKGVEKPVTFPFTVSKANEFAGNFQLNRLDFGLGNKSLVLSDVVAVGIRVKYPAEVLSTR